MLLTTDKDINPWALIDDILKDLRSMPKFREIWIKRFQSVFEEATMIYQIT